MPKPKPELDAIQRRDAAIDLIQEFGDAPGEPAKAWVIDQVLRTLLGAEYEDWIRDHQQAHPKDSWPTGQKPKPLPESYEAILDRAETIFESRDNASDWLHSPLIVLNGTSPVELLHEPDGKKKVMTLLRRIQTGDFA